jgi:tetratricopeptide (TPR) repeat protein
MDYEHQHPHPDPEIDALIERLKKQLHEISDRIDDLRLAVESGKSLQALHPANHADPETLYPLCTSLCDQGEFRHALPIALHLVAYHAHNPRHAFMAARCLHRLGAHEPALAMYQLCTMVAGSPQAVPSYRAGECLLAMGEKEQALLAFEEAYDLGRASNDYAAIQAMADKRIKQLSARG